MNPTKFTNIRTLTEDAGSGRWLAIYRDELTLEQIGELESVIQEKQKEREEQSKNRAKQKSSVQAWFKKLDAPKEVFDWFNL